MIIEYHYNINGALCSRPQNRIFSNDRKQVKNTQPREIKSKIRTLVIKSLFSIHVFNLLLIFLLNFLIEEILLVSS